MAQPLTIDQASIVITVRERNSGLHEARCIELPTSILLRADEVIE
jgi:hypothetical protein